MWKGIRLRNRVKFDSVSCMVDGKWSLTNICLLSGGVGGVNA